MNRAIASLLVAPVFAAAMGFVLLVVNYSAAAGWILFIAGVSCAIGFRIADRLPPEEHKETPLERQHRILTQALKNNAGTTYGGGPR